MNILLVTSIWSGARPVFFEGSNYPSGMPAFNKMLEKLATDKSINLKIILLCNKEDYEVELKNASWLNNIEIIKFYWNRDSFLNNFISCFQLFKLTNTTIRRTKTDLVYLHGVLGFPSYLSARINKTDVGQRIYGTFLRDKLVSNGVIKTLLNSPFESAAFKCKKKFLIVTDDGTHGDEVVNIFNKKVIPYDFYFLQNGVDVDKNNTFNIKVDRKYIFYPARITEWKRQDLAIDLLNGLSDKNIKLFFAGKVIDKTYYNLLIDKINEFKLNDRVFFLGELNHKETQDTMAKAFAVAAFYDVSCKGNVALEAIAAECLVISYQNRGLDYLISDNYSGVLGVDINDCINKVNNIIENEDYFFNIKNNLKYNNKISTWKERLNYEYNLLTDKEVDL
ncbi:glycosyltransferase family 4 protein [Acinetobacter towneri]|uniref:glycosyltransferase family 4 protein n=1 Tax=Acinetobacter towneri TaxID=202956 RepID=UPI00293499A8|nr:glycosyltransferase family 4 protein [Acinetobacter towneri]WOE28757.1 glycosyltransferase family 4 protein [Acinetobacter towneri]